MQTIPCAFCHSEVPQIEGRIYLGIFVAPNHTFALCSIRCLSKFAQDLRRQYSNISKLRLGQEVPGGTSQPSETAEETEPAE